MRKEKAILSLSCSLHIYLIIQHHLLYNPRPRKEVKREALKNHHRYNDANQKKAEEKEKKQKKRQKKTEIVYYL